MKIRDFAAHPQEEITGFFLVHQRDVRSNKNGEGYLSLILGDDTGSIDARVWDNLEVVPDFGAGAVIKVKGRVQAHRGRNQLSVMQIRLACGEEASPGDFLPKSARDPDEMFSELWSIVSCVGNEALRGLLDRVFADPDTVARFKQAPAAKSMHHAFRGGLLEHVLSLCGLAKLAASHYPGIRLDLLLTGAILHDIGKIRELGYDSSFFYTNEGQLIGHIAGGVQMVREKMGPDFPEDYRVLVEHMILSHHGHLEYGSPKEPLFPEALLLHYLDDLDSKMEAMRACFAAAPGQEWTARSPALDRSLLNLDVFLDPLKKDQKK